MIYFTLFNLYDYLMEELDRLECFYIRRHFIAYFPC